MSKTFKYILDFQGKTDQIKKEIGGLNSNLKSMAVAAAAAFSVGSVIAFAKVSVEAFDVEAKAHQALVTALKGRVDVQQRLIKQAGELQSKTLYGDEETVRAQSLVAAFVKEEEQIKNLIPLIQDMATAKQMDLAGAADLVTKTLAGEMNALGRYGIKVEGAAGSAERLAMIQKGLNDAFGGQAENAARVGTGALKQLGNSYSDLQEVIGKLLITQQNHAGSFTRLLTKATAGLTGFVDKVATWSDAGFTFSQALVAAIASTDEDTQTLKESLIVVTKATDSATTSTNAYAEAAKYQAGSVGYLGEEIVKLNEKLATTNASDLKSISIIGEKIQALEKQKAAIAAIASDPISFRTDSFGAIPTAQVTGKLNVEGSGKAFDITPKMNVEDIVKGMPAYNAAQEDMRAEMAATEAMTQTLATSFAGGFDQIGQSVVSGMGLAEDGLEGFVGGLAQTAIKLISMFLAQALAAAISGASLASTFTGPAAIFTLPAYIAAGVAGVMGAFAAIPAFASGGIVSGPTLGLMGEYPGASSNPEVIAPLSKLKAMMGGNDQAIILQPSIEYTGDRMRIMLNRVERNKYKRT